MMNGKKKTTAKPGPGKNRIKTGKILFSAVIILVIAAFLLTSLLPNRSRRANRQANEPSATVQVPEFRKDGSLSFFTSGTADTVSIDIEVVDTQAEIMRGLMYRPYLPERSGMLFVFDEEEERSFWMKNTYISLDIIYVNADLEIVTIQDNTQPLSTQPVLSYKPARYVVEVNAGFTSRNHIQVGDRIVFKR